MAHQQSCESCRERFDYLAASVPTATRATGSQSYRRYTPEEVFAACAQRRPVSVRGLAAMVMLVLVLVYAKAAIRSPTSDWDDKTAWAKDVLAGAAVVLHPDETTIRWPRHIRVVAPAGTDALSLRITTESERIWEWSINPTTEGAFFDSGSLRQDGKSQKPTSIAMITAPFPSKEDMNLSPGVEIQLIASVRGVSGPIQRFRIP